MIYKIVSKMYYIIPNSVECLNYAMDIAKKINGKSRVVIDTDFKNTYENRSKNSNNSQVIFIDSEFETHKDINLNNIKMSLSNFLKNI
jgi:hypothetical protein